MMRSAFLVVGFALCTHTTLPMQPPAPAADDTGAVALAHHQQNVQNADAAHQAGVQVNNFALAIPAWLPGAEGLRHFVQWLRTTLAFFHVRQFGNNFNLGNILGGNADAFINVEFRPIELLIRGLAHARNRSIELGTRYRKELIIGTGAVVGTYASYQLIAFLYNNYYPPRLYARARQIVYELTSNPLVSTQSEATFLSTVNHLQRINPSKKNMYDSAVIELTKVNKELDRALRILTRAAHNNADTQLVANCTELSQLITKLQEKIGSRIALLKAQPWWLAA